MIIDIVLTAQGEIGIYVQDGSFAAGKEAVAALFAALGAQMPLVNRTDVESHRPNAAQIEEHQHAHQPTHLPAGAGHDR